MFSCTMNSRNRPFSASFTLLYFFFARPHTTGSQESTRESTMGSMEGHTKGLIIGWKFEALKLMMRKCNDVIILILGQE
jgi:hypothetical protein